MKRGKLLLTAAGLLFSTIPPLWATLAYFPIWNSKGGGAMLSGMTVMLILISFTPLFNLVKKHFKTPSAPILWFVIFVAFFVLARIADEMKVISFAGFIGNVIGAFFFRLAKRGGGNDEGA